MANFDAVIFDLDGTLIESPLDLSVVRRELAVPEGRFILDYVNALAEEPRRAAYAYLAEVESNAAERAQVLPHTLDVLSALRTKKITTAVATNNSFSTWQKVQQRLALHVDVVATRDHGSYKPHPELVLWILEKWLFEPARVLFVGDHWIDVMAGNAAGVTTCWLHEKPDIRLAKPHHVIRNLLQLNELIFLTRG